jgi:UDP:flavonoid glycosyltransferase YjiC (YdhE family)
MPAGDPVPAQPRRAPTANADVARPPRAEPAARRRFLVAAFGDAGHAFPMIALGRRLAERGHAVCLETWPRWRAHVEDAGMAFAEAPSYPVFPTPELPGEPYSAAVPAAAMTRRLIREWRPDACVHDILTLAPALAAECEGVPVATLVPHIFPLGAPGLPVYSIGARLPRTRMGAAVWDRAARWMQDPLELGRSQYNASRAKLGLRPLPYVHTGLSRELTLVATLPQLEYPRDWPSWTRVVGPLAWEPPATAPVAPPPGDAPLVLVAPSTAQDRDRSLLRAALRGLAGEPVHLIASADRAAGESRLPEPGNAVLAPWLSYAETMPQCDVVITHGGHGTLARALTGGCPVIVCPAGGDMGENAARVEWAGLGVRLPRRLLSPRNLRLSLRRVLGDPGYRRRAAALAQWASTHEGCATAVHELESWLERRTPRR